MTGIRCDVRRAKGLLCGALLVHSTDAIGRIHWTCPACTRRKAGICRDCPRPVVGKRGRAEYCASCRTARLRQNDRNWRLRDPERYKRMAAESCARVRARQRAGMPPMTKTEKGRIAGAARAAALSPQRRSEIARRAVQARWARARAKAAA